MDNLSKLSNEELINLKKNYSVEYVKYHNYQLAKKTQLNSAYGAMGNEYFRFFDTRLASAVTVSGQVIIQWIAQDINKYLNSLLKTVNVDYVIAIDTDSVYICFNDLVKKIFKENKEDRKKITKFLDKFSEDKISEIIKQSTKNFAEYTNAFSQKMKMKRENISDTGIWTAKKKYILSICNDEDRITYDPPLIKIMGLEAKKSNIPEISRKSLKEAINIILTKNQEDLYHFVEKFKEHFFLAPLDEIASPSGLNELDKYEGTDNIYAKGCPMHIRAALVYNNMLKQNNLLTKYPSIKQGDKIRYLLLKEPNITKNNVIGFLDVLPDEFMLKNKIDLEGQFQKVFLKPLEIILTAINWKAEREANLDSIFG